MSAVATPEVEEAIKALVADITTVEEAEALSESLDLLFASWSRFYAMLEREGLGDFLNFRVQGNVVEFRLNTEYRVRSNWTADGKNLETYLTFMRLKLKPTYVGEEYNLFVSKTLNTIYDANSALTVLMLKYEEAQSVSGAESNNALEMYTDMFEIIIRNLKKDFTQYGISFDKDTVIKLFILIFFQQTGNLALTPLEKVFELMGSYKDFSLIAYALNPVVYKGSGGVLPDEEFLRGAKDVPLSWVAEILQDSKQK